APPRRCSCAPAPARRCSARPVPPRSPRPSRPRPGPSRPEALAEIGSRTVGRHTEVPTGGERTDVTSDRRPRILPTLERDAVRPRRHTGRPAEQRPERARAREPDLPGDALDAVVGRLQQLLRVP